MGSHGRILAKETLLRLGSLESFKAPQPQITALLRGEGSDSIGIAHKTAGILKTAHPVKFLIQREMNRLNCDIYDDIEWHKWTVVFGRSLLNSSLSSPNTENQLWRIGSAAEAGMFSADIHQTMYEIGGNEFESANRYAALVGDFFAVKCISTAAQLKNSAAFLAFTRGIEDFTTAAFPSLFTEDFLPRKTATIGDWKIYAGKLPGYFTGGLAAAIELIHPSSSLKKEIETFVPTIGKCITGTRELRNLDGPFAFTTLPAIILQKKKPKIFNGLKFPFYEDETAEVRNELWNSSSVEEARAIVDDSIENAVKSFTSFANPNVYSEGFIQLLRSLKDSPKRKIDSMHERNKNEVLDFAQTAPNFS